MVSGLRGLVRLLVHPQWSRSLQYALMPLFSASCYPNLFSNVSQSFPVYLKKFCQYSLLTAVLNSKKFLFKALSPLLNARYVTSVLSLHKKYFFTIISSVFV